MVLISICFRAGPGRVLGLIATDLASTILKLASAYCVKLVVDAVVAGTRGGAELAALETASAIGIASLVSQGYLRLTDRVIDEAAGEIDQHLIRLASEVGTIDHFERRDYLDQMTLLHEDRAAMAQMVNAIVLNLRVAVSVLGTSLMLAWVDPVLLCLPAAGVPLLLAHRIAKKRTSRARELNAPHSRMREHLFQTATSPEAGPELRLLGLGGELRRRHGDEFAAMGRRTFRAALSGWGLVALAGIGFIVVYALALESSLHATSGAGNLGSSLLALTLFGLISSQMSMAAVTSNYLQQVVQTGERLIWLEDFVAGQQERGLVTQQEHEQQREGGAGRPTSRPAPVPTKLHRGISLCDVSFRYPGGEREVVSSVNLDLPAGCCVALVGENGSGKSTLVKLLLRMYLPTSGLIDVDGIPMEQFDQREWLKATTAGFQDHARLETSVHTAVGLGDLPAMNNPGAVTAAIRRAGAAGFVSQLPQQEDTQLGAAWPGGVELSGGQWQKVALSRALMRPAPLLTVMDEPAASLDAMSEHEFFERLLAMRSKSAQSGGILLFVSHRFTTARAADLIVVLKNGRVEQSGTHSELAQTEGLYAELFRMQSRIYQ